MSKNCKTKPLLNNDLVTVIQSVFANDGTALKPAIEFDPRQKTNIGLSVKADNFIAYVNSNPHPSAEFLKTNIFSEVLVFFCDNLRQYHQSSLCGRLCKQKRQIWSRNKKFIFFPLQNSASL